MDLVYSFMKNEEPVCGSPPFEVPRMRYVQAGLAIQVSKDLEGTGNLKQNAYLLEEFIDSEEPGWFVKYLNNNSAKPHKFKDEERSIRAEFLSFSQHVQFIETGGQAYLSDLQGRYPGPSLRFSDIKFNLPSIILLGGPTLLTDPQIITNP
jgi:hypothetical protein